MCAVFISKFQNVKNYCNNVSPIMVYSLIKLVEFKQPNENTPDLSNQTKGQLKKKPKSLKKLTFCGLPFSITTTNHENEMRDS